MSQFPTITIVNPIHISHCPSPISIPIHHPGVAKHSRRQKTVPTLVQQTLLYHQYDMRAQLLYLFSLRKILNEKFIIICVYNLILLKLKYFCFVCGDSGATARFLMNTRRAVASNYVHLCRQQNDFVMCCMHLVS